MKTLITAASTLLLFAAGLLLPATAKADGSPVDCSQGCYIVTCDAQTCSLWRCDTGGCRLLTDWPSEWSQPQSVPGEPRQKRPAPLAYAKVCVPDGDCTLYQLGVRGAVRVETFDNIDDAVRRRPVQGSVRQ
ncbi:hypothetical protein [Arenimonas sp. MALMAid1274]|uniref:hypothetical protein n=1 Tax=Arenimonas sp. MALMAid1274 TaxID=3411630 RepID=UPI003BA0E266